VLATVLNKRGVAGEGADHHTRGRVCSPENSRPVSGEDWCQTKPLENGWAKPYSPVMMKLELYSDAMLTCDLPQHRLRRGDIVKLVEHHTAPDGSEGFSIEVFNAVGDTIAVTAVPSSALEVLREDEILCARPLACA